MQQAILMVLALGVAANLVIAFLAFRDGAYSQVAIAVALAALCGGVAYLRIKLTDKN